MEVDVYLSQTKIYLLPQTIIITANEWIKTPNHYSLYIFICSSSTVGVMVPPVLVDMDADGVKDILMSAYDGTLALFNGATLKLMWAREFSGYESYR